MTAQQAKTEVSQRAEQTADYIRDAVSGWSVTARFREYNDETEFFVYADESDLSTNGYAKASVINTVLREVPAVEVKGTQDGDMAVSFCYVNE